MYQRKLAPLDGSKQAESALLLASELARIYSAELILLRVGVSADEEAVRLEKRNGQLTLRRASKMKSELVDLQDIRCFNLSLSACQNQPYRRSIGF